MASSRPSTRYAGQISFVLLVWMATVAIPVSAGGITYATLKSLQVAESTEINNLQREIAVCNMNINQYRAKTDEMTNRWVMRNRLETTGSRLRPIDRHQIQTARRLTDGSRMTFNTIEQN